MNINPISFGASASEIKNIKRACDDLSKNIKDGNPTTAVVDTDEKDGKLLLSFAPSEEGVSKLHAKYYKDEDTFASTTLTEGSSEENIKYIKKDSNQDKIARLLDKFKESIREMQEREY